jgi:three-Cys-motif partner protein
VSLERLQQLEDDRLVLPEVGAWAETKYRLVQTLSGMIATAMRPPKWDEGVYVDLFAGAGRAHVKGTSHIVPTSASLAVGVKRPFDRYVLCELNPENAEALRIRMARDAPQAPVTVIEGDCNECTASIGAAVVPSPARRVLTFCVVDPYKLKDLRFRTISDLAQRLSARGRRAVDFLVLVPTYMDAHRNRKYYVPAKSTIVEQFLGRPEWRQEWDGWQTSGGSREFGAFVLDAFSRSMQELGFLYDGLGEEEPVRLDQGTRLYHLVVFSRHSLGRDFWRKAKKTSLAQLGFAWDVPLPARARRGS